ncbi:MAG: ribonuclease [Candidatus Parcubacteria bacterium]|nr:ribonuclease [Candidatus Parcubacteria bacterium]
MKEFQTTIFTDGSSRGNPGPGGWGALVIAEDTVPCVKELGGGEADTTNNRMEIKAAIEGLRHSDKNSKIIVNTDSSYLINGITKWVKGWKRNGWKTKTKDEVLNRDLWEELHDLAEGRTITWSYVGGHVGVLGNERCDHIATAFADGRELKLYDGPLAGYDLPNVLDVSRNEMKAVTKKSSSSHSRAPAHSYVSSVGGVIETHRTWAECEKRVKGARGARYKKSTSAENEASIIEEFGAFGNEIG